MKNKHSIFLLILSLSIISGTAWAAGSSGNSGNSTSTTTSSKVTIFAQAKKLIKKHQYAAAIPLLEQASNDQPNNAHIFNELGYAHREEGHYDIALRNYEIALGLDDEHKGALNYLGMLYIETGKLSKAREMLVRLDDACSFGCDEFDSLEKAIKTGVVPD